MRTKFIIWAIFLHLFIIVGLLLAFKEKPIILLIGEVAVVASFIFFIYYLRNANSALKSITSGLALIKEKDFNTRLSKTGTKEIDQLIEFYNKMMKEIREEKIKLEEQNFFLDLLINASPMGIIILNLDNEITRVNDATMKIIGTNGFKTGKRLADVSHPIVNSLVSLNYDQSKLINIEGQKRVRIQKRYFYDRGFQHPFYLIEELTNELLETEKTAYSKVIRMMSHEVNNSAGAINSILESFVEIFDNSKELSQGDYTKVLNAAINRNIELKNFMQNFAEVVKVPQPVKQSFELKELVDSILLLMTPQMRKKNIKHTTNYPTNQVFVDADKGQIEQVIVNIIKNSMEAIISDGEIRIEINTNPLSLIISDNGCGIDEITMQRLFTPFYSSKTKGQGIGLTIIREILSNHHFTYSLKSQDDWTNFQITF